MLEVRYDGAQTDFTLISKTIQMIVETPVNIYFSYLIIKFCIMSIRLHKTMDGLEKADTTVAVIFTSVAVLFVLHYLLNIFLYAFPFVTLYFYESPYWK